MVIEYVAAAAAVSLVIIAMLYCDSCTTMQARRLCRSFACAFFRAELAFFFFFFNYFARARWRRRRRRSVWDSCLSTTHSMLGPLVDDHLIYCNITHTRTINERQRPREKKKKKSGELKWKRFAACKEAGCFYNALLHPPLDIGEI